MFTSVHNNTKMTTKNSTTSGLRRKKATINKQPISCVQLRISLPFVVVTLPAQQKNKTKIVNK